MILLHALLRRPELFYPLDCHTWKNCGREILHRGSHSDRLCGIRGHYQRKHESAFLSGDLQGGAHRSTDFVGAALALVLVGTITALVGAYLRRFSIRYVLASDLSAKSEDSAGPRDASLLNVLQPETLR